MKNAIFAVIVGLGLATSAWSGNGAEPLEFLRLDANARAVALGGAYTALASDSNALLYNPAGLGHVRRYEASFMHNQFYEGVTQEYISLATPRGWGLSFNYLSFGGVPKTTVANPDSLGTTGLSDLAVSAGYGKRFGNLLSLGAELKMIRESIDGISAQGYAADFGALYDVPQVSGLSIGGALQNIGPPIKFQGANENLPLNARFGTAYRFTTQKQKCTITLDLTKERSEAPIVLLGAEMILAEKFPVRFGYSGQNDSGLGITFGAGYRHRDFDFDYAFAPYGALGNAHRFSVTARWGAKTE